MSQIREFDTQKRISRGVDTLCDHRFCRCVVALICSADLFGSSDGFDDLCFACCWWGGSAALDGALLWCSAPSFAVYT